MSGLLKFATVLELHQYRPGASATFKGARHSEEDDQYTVYLTFPGQDYEDIGAPETITVTVEPGNTLESEDLFPPDFRTSVVDTLLAGPHGTSGPTGAEEPFQAEELQEAEDEDENQ